MLEINSEIVTTPPRDAATVVVLRDGSKGLEVLLIRRHGKSDVLGGAYVFPGGKVDAADGLLPPLRLDRDASVLQAALAEPDLTPLAATALFVAALREVFEEAGILFARSTGPLHAQRARAQLRGGQSFCEVLTQLDLRLDSAAVLPWSRWITPRMPSVSNKRFDTRFFVARLPAGQTAQHDDHEATDSLWLPPSEALQQYWDGQIALAPPQIMSLAHLARHASAASVLAEAARRPPPLIEPEPFDEAGTRVLTYPGDPRHSVTHQALPGPTRLYHRNRRFEPADGFSALLG